jgi:glutamate synthase (NADPH/NADH) large chain
MDEVDQQRGLYVPSEERDSCGVGLIADLSAIQSNKTVLSALTMLENMEHRGACGCEENTGDGAGILSQIPFDFFKKISHEEGVELPAASQYGVGMFFFPKDKTKRSFCDQVVKTVCKQYNFEILLSRKVPTDNGMIGQSALNTEPDIVQIFLRSIDNPLYSNLEKQLYFLKTAILRGVYFEDESLTDEFYIASLSSKTIVYKGQLKATQLRHYYKDLQDSTFTSALAIIHSRFSTNTVPKWKLAQPFRCIAHNGEINTIQGNINWWQAREKFMEKSGTYSDSWVEALPVCDPYSSDSGNFDNVVDFLIRTTRSIPHAMMMMIPEAWQNDKKMPDFKRSFYEYHDAVLEPWDGPAAICFTDGNLVGATLDRNGLRPARYVVTNDNRLILASEAGCLVIDQSKIIRKGRLQPGKMLVADLDENRIISDLELKEVICKRFPYGKWLSHQSKHISDYYLADSNEYIPKYPLIQRQVAFGLTKEDEELILSAMSNTAKEPIGSMGADIPLAILSSIAQHISNYFKQQFAQVTNPPIDSLREKYFMSLKTTLGGTSKILNVSEHEARTIKIDSPVLDANEFMAIAQIRSKYFRSGTIETVYPKGKTLEAAIDEICDQLKEKVEKGYNIICFSDRNISEDHIPIPSLLIAGAAHHQLIQSGDRKEISIIMDVGDVWETHHFATLLSFGADAISPYLAMETVAKLGSEVSLSPDLLVSNYTKAVEKGLLKIMSKLGVSTLSSYKGSQTFEAVGISSEVIDKCFKGTVSRIGGMRFSDLQKENEAKFNLAFQSSMSALPDTGVFQWKKKGEYHLFNPQTIHLLQHSTRLNDFEIFKKYTQEINKAEKNASTLRSFFKVKKTKGISIDEVEPVESILKRFATGAMSFGSISHEAHTTLAKAMNRIGGKSNSGEGGEDEKRFEKLPNGDWERSAIKQVASGRFGVTINYLTNAEELQIKMAQGAKPGEGGQLPGHKVDENIARVRHSTPGVGLISPPPHHDIYSIEDLAQLIFDLKNANRKARISVKLVSKTGVGVIASGVTKAHADHILISGHDGGTGASPLSSIRHAGLPWEMGLAETHQTLVRNNLRDRVVLQCDGQIRTGRDMAIATMLGAEEWGIATAALVVEGCILMRKCHLNTCPVGIATQDTELRKKFNGKVDHLVNYFRFLAQDLREIMASCGVRTINELVGRSDLLEMDKEGRHWKAQQVELSSILFQEKPEDGYTLFQSRMQDHGLENVLDRKLIKKVAPVFNGDKKIELDLPIESTDRAVGTMLSNEVAKKYGAKGLNSDTISINFTGSAGQSFGAFLAPGISFNLNGESNDYFGKGLSGGKLVVVPDKRAIFNPQKNIIIGNVAMYGATSGEAYIKGMAGDRFCVRNSGAVTVVEGVGDNGCEYMTGGRVVVLGRIGKNFAAGMSGGIAYIYQASKDRSERVNQKMVYIEKPDTSDLKELKSMIQKHFEYTSSNLALDILNDWYEHSAFFIKIIPKEYKAVLKMKENMRGFKTLAS